MSALSSFIRNGLSYALVLMLFACGGGGSGSDDGQNGTGTNDAVGVANRSVPDNVFSAVLNSAREIPANDSTAIGVVLIDPAARLLRASLTVAGVAATAARIHVPVAGMPGQIALSLTETPAGSGVWSAQATITEDQLRALRNGDFNFSANSTAFPQAEISGQIVPGLPASGGANAVGLTPDINGVDSGGFTTGNAIAANPATPLVPGSTTGIRIGPGGLDTVGAVGAIGNNAATGTTPLSGTVTQRAAFVNVLTGTQQVPADSSLAIAVGVIIVDAASQDMVASVSSLGISGLSAHIHQAAPGENGAAIFALNETTVGSGIWAARLALAESQRNALAGGNYYFDIHSAAFPNGELRGQIAASSGSGNFNIGSPGITANGAPASGVTTDTPFVPGSVIGSNDTGNAVPGTIGAGVPSFGNPMGSGIGGAGSNAFTGTPVPTFGNPAGSGIGIGTTF
jgi:hypothetical protein